MTGSGLFSGFLPQLVHVTARVIELIGVSIIAVGAIGSLAVFAGRIVRRADFEESIVWTRSRLGRSILLGLEFLVAADIINTITIQPTLQSVAVLAGIVLIRTFLSFSLEAEIEGRWPWQKATAKQGGRNG